MKNLIVRTFFVVSLFAAVSQAAELQSRRECVAGLRVTFQGGSGTIVGVDPAGNLMCTVKVDGSGQQRNFVYWMLSSAGGASPAKAGPVVLTPGTEFKTQRECVPGAAVTVADSKGLDDGGTGTMIGPSKLGGIICDVTMSNGKQRGVAYWLIGLTSAQGKAQPAAARAVPAQNAAPAGGGSLGNLAGTSWLELSITRKGDPEKTGSSITPRYQFCRDRSFEIYHGYSAQGGKYEVQSGHLVMTYSGGRLYGNFAVRQSGNEMFLDNGEYVIRLKYNGAGCDGR